MHIIIPPQDWTLPCSDRGMNMMSKLTSELQSALLQREALMEDSIQDTFGSSAKVALQIPKLNILRAWWIFSDTSRDWQTFGNEDTHNTQLDYPNEVTCANISYYYIPTAYM